MSPREQEKLDKFINKNLCKKYIRPSKSPQASPFFFITKKDSEKLRPCQDYRRLNNWTIKNAYYPLPHIGDLLDKLKGAKYYMKFDLRWGYNNVRIKEGDEWKAAFKMNKELFEPTVIFFGLCNSPSTFQNIMNDIFKEEINEGWLLIYMDDILIFTDDHSKIEGYTKRILQKLHDNDLFLNLDKCVFDVTKVEYLVLIIRKDEITIELTKLAEITDWPTPTTVKQVQSFLGFANFYRWFIGKFAEISLPLTALMKKDLTWNWTTECQEVFDMLKKKFQEAPILLMLDNKKLFILETDASKWASGEVLQQQDINGDWHPCGFISHTFNPTERNYKIYDQELLSIIQGLETWHHYLHRSPSTTVILSDHKNLTYFWTAQKLNQGQARWSLYLSEFDLKLLHTPGSKMIQSDALSHHPGHITNDNDNDDIILLPDSLFVWIVDRQWPSLLHIWSNYERHSLCIHIRSLENKWAISHHIEIGRLASWRWTTLFQRQMFYTGWWRPQMRHHRLLPWLPSWRTLQTPENTQTDPLKLLVARDDCIHQELHRQLHYMPTNESQHPPLSPRPVSDQGTNKHLTLFTSHLWLHYWPPWMWQLWFPHGHGQPQIFKGGNFYPLQQNNDITVERLCLYLHFSHGYVSTECNVGPIINIILLELLVLIATYESLNTTGTPLIMIIGTVSLRA